LSRFFCSFFQESLTLNRSYFLFRFSPFPSYAISLHGAHGTPYPGTRGPPEILSFPDEPNLFPLYTTPSQLAARPATLGTNSTHHITKKTGSNNLKVKIPTSKSRAEENLSKPSKPVPQTCPTTKPGFVDYESIPFLPPLPSRESFFFFCTCSLQRSSHDRPLIIPLGLLYEPYRYISYLPFKIVMCPTQFMLTYFKLSIPFSLLLLAGPSPFIRFPNS